jgi:hypothetical protein
MNGFGLEAVVPLVPLVGEEYRKWIFDIEHRLNDSGRQTFDRHSEDSPFKLEHTFTPGLYTRELSMPKGGLLISRIHIFEHPFILSKGEISIYDGEKVLRIKAPYRGITKPGTKRIIYMHDDSILTTFHVTDKCTLEDVDVNGVITCETFEEFDAFVTKEITP